MPHTDGRQIDLKSFFAEDMRRAFPATAVRVVPDGGHFVIAIDAAHAYTPEAATNIAGAIGQMLTEAFASDDVRWLDGRPFVVPVIRP